MVNNLVNQVAKLPGYVLAIAALALGGTASVGHASGASPTQQMKAFSTYSVTRPTRSNRQMAQDFLDLHFKLETGVKLPALIKFEGPVTFRVEGGMPRALLSDFTHLRTRLRTEAKISLHHSPNGAANINIIMVPQSFIKREAGNTICFTVPNVTSAANFHVQKRARNLSWTGVQSRKTVAIFIPNNVAPQTMRDCLHEEIAQALGPLNDLYRLPDSVFNDDGFHKVLTGFDMLMLRTLYHPSLRSGMTYDQVAAKLPGLLNALNPKGRSGRNQMVKTSSPAWTKSMTYALYSGASVKRRLQAAERAVLSQPSMGEDVRKGFALYTMARLSMAGGGDAARSFLGQADRIFTTSPAMAIHRADLAQYRAAYALRSGDGHKTMDIIRPHIKAAYYHQDARILSSLMFYQAEALKLTGRVSEAQVVRLDAVAWARYGYGKDSAVRRVMRDIASLSPANAR